MPVHRPGSTPVFFEYVCGRAIADSQGQLPPAVTQLNGTPFRIPTFQRGISWGEEDITRLLNSDSPVFGTAVFGMFHNAPGVLIDGLQRFAAGTALLHNLWDRVISPNPTNPAAQAHFVRLRARVQALQPVYAHNHDQFLSHSRNAVRNQYAAMYAEVQQMLDGMLAPQRVAAEAGRINSCMLDKQIAIDEYFGFAGEADLANTFIGLNTVRVQLGPIDLIRSYIVDRAVSAAPPWSVADVSRVENDITDTFVQTNGEAIKELEPTATVILKCLQARGPLQPTLVFPGWAALTPAEVDRFLDFMDQMRGAANPYVREIRECGSLPFALVVLFHYRQFVATGANPSFLAGGTATDADLHLLLRATYRVLLDGRIGRLGNVAENVIRGLYASMADVAEAVASESSAGPLANSADPDWTRAALSRADAKRAKRVFNACLLPDRVTPGGPFAPKTYGRGAQHWQIDHLLPEANFQAQRNQPGYAEANTLRNFAPLPQPVNRHLGNKPCSQKLAPGNDYATCIQQVNQQHPFLAWLVQQQGGHGAALDTLALLEPNAQNGSAIGDERIAQLVAMLAPKL